MPNAVSIFPLGELCSFVGGGTPSRKVPEYFTGKIPWATVKDFKQYRLADTEEHITEEAVADSAVNIVEAGSVLLVSRVGLGKVAMANARLAINQDIKALTPRDDVLPEYLFWFLLSKASDIERMGTGATVKGVTLNDIKAIRMPVPSLPEQRRIVDLLSRAEGIVRLRREAEKKAAELIPALFQDMFGDPVTNPKGWAVALLPDVLSRPFKNGLYLPKEKYAPEGSGEGVEMVHMSDAFYGEVKRGHLRRVLADEKQINDYGLTRADLLVARRSLNFDGAAKLCGIPESEQPLLFESSFIRLTPKLDTVKTEYLLHYLNNESTRRAYVLSRITGITISGINQAAMNKIPVLLPPMPIQDNFAIKASEVQSIQSQQSTATANAQAAFDALLASAFA